MASSMGRSAICMSGAPDPGAFDHEVGPQSLREVEAVAGLHHAVDAREQRPQALQLELAADADARIGVGDAAPAQEAARRGPQMRLGPAARRAVVEGYGVREAILARAQRLLQDVRAAGAAACL